MDESKYFFRKVVYTNKDGKTELIIGFEPIKTSPLEPWMSLVFLLADGLHTIEQLHEHIANLYKGNVPTDYKRTIDSVIKRLLESEVIGTSEKTMQLPPYLLTPFDEQVKKDSLKVMLEDGYLKVEDLDKL